jgi:hypothetical protein
MCSWHISEQARPPEHKGRAGKSAIMMESRNIGGTIGKCEKHAPSYMETSERMELLQEMR